MPETEVETPVVAPVVTDDKKEIIEEEAAKAEAEKAEAEKKDEEKKDTEEDKESSPKKEKAKKEKKPKEPAPPPPPSVHKKDFEKEVVYLYQFPRCPTLPNISPKCLQVETWLKLHGIKYENINHNGKLRSKRGFLPFVELNGEEMDSDLIVKNLAKKYEKEMDESLTSEQKNIQHAMVQMVDKHLHGAFLHWASRSADDMIKGYKLNLQQFTGYKVPNGILNFWFKFQHCRKGLKKAKAAVGTGYSADEVDAEGKQDLKVLSEMLADKEFFFGDEPHSLDLVTFAHLAQIINVDSEEVKCPLKEYLESDCTNLVGLYNRMKDRAWGDHWEEAIGEKLELNPHIPKPDPPQPEEPEKAEPEAEKKEEEKAEDKTEEDDNKKEEEKEKSDEKKEDEKKE